MHHPIGSIVHTMAFVKPVMEHWLNWEIAWCVHHEGSIRRPIAPWADALPRSYTMLPGVGSIHSGVNTVCGLLSVILARVFDPCAEWWKSKLSLISLWRCLTTKRERDPALTASDTPDLVPVMACHKYSRPAINIHVGHQCVWLVRPGVLACHLQ